MGADLANNAAMKPVLPLLAANPEISAAEVFKRTNVRVTDVELRDAAETLVHAATTFADLNAAGLQSVLAEHMKQTVDGASLADDAELAPSSSTAPLSSSIPFAGNGAAAMHVSVGNSAVSAAASAAALAARGGAGATAGPGSGGSGSGSSGSSGSGGKSGKSSGDAHDRSKEKSRRNADGAKQWRDAQKDDAAFRQKEAERKRIARAAQKEAKDKEAGRKRKKRWKDGGKARGRGGGRGRGRGACESQPIEKS